MIQILQRVLRDFRSWERSLRLTLGLAAALLALLTLVIAFGPLEVRLYACIGAFGLIGVMQISVMIAYRGMVTPLVRAQRHFMAGEFEAARDVLQAARQAGELDMRALTLLGNTLRQLGDIGGSRAILSEALHKSPDHHYPMYGYGRTLLVDGQYAEAAAMFARALAAGAPEATRLDLAEAYWRAGQHEQAHAALEQSKALLPHVEAHRQVLAAYLTAMMQGKAPPPGDPQGVAFWEASAVRFGHTPYGRDLVVDVRRMQGASGP